MKVLITGSNGFVGKALCKEIEHIKFDLPEQDILNQDQVDEYVSKADLVLHAAAIADLYDSHDDPDKTFEVNIRGTYNIMKACKKFNKRLVYISTCCAYGDQGGKPTDENSIPNPADWYARSKLAGEAICHEVGALILRIGTVFGPGMRKSLFNYQVLKKIHNGEEITLDGDGTTSRNYVYIDDLVNGIIYAISTGYRVVNICNPGPTTLMEVINTACKIVGRPVTYKIGEKREYGDYISNVSSLLNKKYLNGFSMPLWMPKYNYSDGMKKTYEWMLKEGHIG